MSSKLLIFDFDGTLADTFPSFVRVFDQAADKYGFKRLDRERQDVLRGLDARQIMAHHDVPLWKVPAIARFMRVRMADDIGNIKLFTGIGQALLALHAQRVALTIVTSNSPGNVRAVLGPELLALFSHVECGASLFGKPSKIRRVLAATGTAPEHAMLIGDEIRDAKAAADAGIDFGAVAWGFNHVDALAAQHPQRIFHHVDDLLDLSPDTALLRQG
ncbi:HAD hydrolase-like protein [Burkholderia sp. LMU1-1-1.1]|uniref:HAD hydrolase-like protein n=1 Tax=Burkholderia sp. LMU1-1-1.1 TaxID=3135266 RepID=UPI00342EB40F